MLANGANAFVYSTTDNKYVIRITPMNTNNLVEINDIVNKKQLINKKLMKNDKDCLDNIACSYHIFTENINTQGINNTYTVEIIQKYDKALNNFMYMHSEVDNNIHDLNVYYDLVFNDIKYLTNFYEVATILIESLENLHKNGIAHGDVKPHNILIKTDNMNFIIDIALSDFDNVCIKDNKYDTFDKNNKNAKNDTTSKLHNLFTKITNMFSKKIEQKNLSNDLSKDLSKDCEQMPGTQLYSTPEYIIANKPTNNTSIIHTKYNIDIMKRTDIYAMSLVILMLWFGYTEFFKLGAIGDVNANDNKVEILMIDMFDQNNIKIHNVVSNLIKAINKSYNNLINHYDTIIKQDSNYYKLINDTHKLLLTCLKNLQNVKQFVNEKHTIEIPQPNSNQPRKMIINRMRILNGGHVLNNNKYQYKYLKYKQKYLESKFNK